MHHFDFLDDSLFRRLPRKGDAPSVDGKIAECWQEGVGIRQTRIAVHRICGVHVSFERVHDIFVDLSASYRVDDEELPACAGAC